ncbi:exonuclease domain-containing protein [Amycolatopsis magusensis]|uniref:DNA polymerase-3 subunit epsilon n=1 Tax=Amycolatopsis magusensis TaxID=882444 RepID=A0ABS4PVW5_9PSEU|nr:exonuclease domain-containing protein [Amycolatopsis magusensis]MBP2183573.1 DNA polymerase-3 subunit epsilon [Amycolatopsis magusensis]
MTTQGGYAVVDTETTGIHTGWHHRIAEVAVIHVDPDGVVTDEWSTLVNPDRDLGPQAIHRIRAADVRRAPRFGLVAGDIVERLRGRIVVAHNWPFDAMHLRAEFDRLEISTPYDPRSGVCTMQAARVLGLGSRRSLIDCCAAAGLPARSWHTAHDDALAAAELLGFILNHAPEKLAITEAHLRAAAWAWPSLPSGRVAPVHRQPAGHVEPHFLARLVERIPRDGVPEFDAYFAMLDDALLDRQISATEGDALLDLAYDLGLHRDEVLTAHVDYLRLLARAAWADEVVTADERRELHTVATLLGLERTLVDRVLEEECASAPDPEISRPLVLGGLTLEAGDKVVLTGKMRHERDELIALAAAVGIQVTADVGKKTRVVAAADPDSLSGKAKRARAFGVPVVSEDAFLRAIDILAQETLAEASLSDTLA